MIVICSYCHKELDETPPLEDKIVTHSICQECFDYYKDQVDGLSFDAYLEKFHVPVLIVDKDARILASNNQSASMTGRSPSKLAGLLGGDAMECVYARMPGGCGKMAHCLECSIRNTVDATMVTGQPQKKIPAFLTQEDREIKILLSTETIGGVVRIVIEKLDVI